MKNHGWPVSILLLGWLLCQCGNGIGDDGASGSNRTQGVSHHAASLHPPKPTTPSTAGSGSPLPPTPSITPNVTLTSSSSTSSPPPSTTQTQSKVTASSSAPASPVTNIDSSTATWDKLSPRRNGSDENEGGNFLLEGAQLENDNGKPLQSSKSLSTSTVHPTSLPTSASSSSSSSISSTTSLSPSSSSSSFTPSTYSTTIKSQQQNQHQQRSKLWAPHSNVNVQDLLKALDDDGDSLITSPGERSRTNDASPTTPTSNPPPSPSTSNNKNNMNHLPSEKVAGHQQQQQTRSIRSIRLIANNNSSGNGGAPGISKIFHSSEHPHDGGESQQAGTQDLGDSVEQNENEKGNTAGVGASPVFHVNNNKFPVISSIRHYRSRKSFSRTRKTTNPNGRGSGDGGGLAAATSTDNNKNIQDNPVATATSPEKVGGKSKTFSEKWITARVKSSSSEEMPQGDEPPQTRDEEVEEDDEDEEHYYGRVETRKMLRTKSQNNFPDDDDDDDGGVGHYGKVMDKPIGAASPRERSGYSSTSSDDTHSPAVYERPYFTEKEHEAGLSSSAEEDAAVNRQNNRASRNRNGGKGFTEEEGKDDDTLILQRINKTFLSSRNSNSRRQQQRQMEMGNGEIIARNRNNGTPSIRQGSRSDSSDGISSYSSSGSGANINTSGYRHPPQNTLMASSTTSFFSSNKESRDKLKPIRNDSDDGNGDGESGKAIHSLQAMSASSIESHSGTQPTGDGRGGRKKQRNRDRNGGGGGIGQSRQNKERRGKQKGTRKPIAPMPNDPFSPDGNGSGSESQANDFHTLQGQQAKSISSSDSGTKLSSAPDSAWSRQSNSGVVDSMVDEIDDGDRNSREQRRKQRPQRVHQKESSFPSSQHSPSSLSSSDKSNRRKESDPLTGKRSSLSEIRELKGKPDNSDPVKTRKSSELEYFPRVNSFSGSGDEDHAISEAGAFSSNDNLFDEYRPLGHEYYNGGGDLLLDDDIGVESASPLSGPDLTPSSGTSSVSPRNKPDSDIVTRFLNIVESQHLVGENCTAGTDFNLGEGVVDRYAQERFRLEAEFAVNRANMLTRMWKYVNESVLDNEYLLHAMVISLVEFDDDIFAGGNCYDQFQYKNYSLFCPFAFRYEGGSILVKDLSLEYNYLGNTSEFFFIARKNAERIIKTYNQFNRGFHQFRINETSMTDPIADEILNVTYEDGKWSKPYFDCGGANIWMITYTVPFFGYDNTSKSYHFKGTSGIDIDLRRVDIDQCPLPDNSTELNIFAGSDKCKNATTMCVAISGLGFRRGSYRCVCKDGFYFPNVTSPHKYYNGTVLEEEYEKKFDSNDTNYYDIDGVFECLRCPGGCDTCVDDRPCVVSLNWLMRSAILILQCAIILMLPIVGLFTYKYSEVKVVRAASPVLLRFIVLGAFFIYCTILVMYPSPSVITCTLRVWLREIGFSLAYGALMLKTWRISVIFRVRSAKAIKITDLDLMKRLGIIVAMFTALLVIRTLVAPPAAIVSLTADDLKAWLCKTDWWDHSFTLMELSFLVWGIRLCIVVRKAPSEFNESKFISLAIYNEFLLSLFLNISMLFLQSPANPDLLYIIFFCHVQLTMTLLLCLIFGSKAYMVFRGQGKGSADESSRMPTSKFISKGRSGGQGTKQLSAHNSTGGLHSSTTSTGHDPNFNSRLSEDVQEEFRRLYSQLEELKERNMRLGNRHLVAKITAMQEAADNILQAPGSQINGQSHQLHQLSPGNNSGVNNGGGNAFPSASSSGSGGGGSGGGGHSPHTKGKSPSAFGPLSDIQEENPLQSLSGGQHGQIHSPPGPKVLETSIDIVIQSESPIRKTAPELGDNGQENNLNNGAHQHPLAHPLADRVEEGGSSTNTVPKGITRSKDTDSSSCQLKRNSASGAGSASERKGQSCSNDGEAYSTTTIPKDQDNSSEVKKLGGREEKAGASSSSSSRKNSPKCVSIEETPTSLIKEQQGLSKKSNCPSSSPSKPPSSKCLKSEKHPHHHKASSSSSTCQKSGEAGSSASSTTEGKTANHKDAAAASGGNGGNGSSQKIILDLDDKSRFTEEITV